MKALDIHTHVYTGERRQAMQAGLKDAAQGLFRSAHVGQDADTGAEHYRSLDIRAVIFDIDAETASGVRISNDEVAEVARRNSDVFIPFGSVDPWKGAAAIREAERCVKELGCRGLKFMPITQAFYPNNPRFYPLWEACQKLAVPCLFHMGVTAIGNGSPGGRGLKLDFSRPIPYLDDIAADFPELTIIGAHPGWPWHDELLAVVRHKGNVYMDLSGWAPKYFPPSVVQYANTLIQDKVLFGSDYPLLSPERWLAEFETLPIKPEVRPKILKDNACRLLGIEG